MLEESLKITFEKEIAVLKFDGELIFDNSNQLKEEAKNRLSTEEKIKNLLIDLSQVSYLDSSGVGVLLSLFKFMRNRSGSMAIANANDKIRRVFEVTKMTEIISVYDNVEQALNELK
ncbi:MAG: STAS domain-containing protein [Bacillota bacterium]